MAGRLIGKGSANSSTVASPSASRRTIERRVGSDKAAKTTSNRSGADTVIVAVLPADTSQSRYLTDRLTTVKGRHACRGGTSLQVPYWAHNFREHQRWLVTSGRARVGVPVKRRRARSWCEPVAASVTGAHVSRMHLAVAHVTGYAFPSGHTTLATAAWGAIVFTAGASAAGGGVSPSPQA